MNLLSLVTPWLDNVCQIKTKVLQRKCYSSQKLKFLRTKRGHESLHKIELQNQRHQKGSVRQQSTVYSERQEESSPRWAKRAAYSKEYSERTTKNPHSWSNANHHHLKQNKANATSSLVVQYNSAHQVHNGELSQVVNNETRPCLVHPENQKVFKILRHIESYNACMKH